MLIQNSIIGERKFLNKLKNIVETSRIKDAILKNTTSVEDYSLQIRINFYGASIYAPLNVKGIIEQNNNSLFFKPSEYTCLIKTIEINKKEIKRINKKMHKVIVEMNSGIKYRFIAKNQDELINKFK